MKKLAAGTSFRTNLTQMTVMDNAAWKVKDNGLYSNAVGKGNSFLYSRAKGKN